MIYNPYIVVPLATWAITQVIKFTVAALRGHIDFRNLYGSGGMPSVHGAVVCSLATTSLLLDGYNSHLFGFTAVFAAIVMYDSFGVRRAAGEQAVALNHLTEALQTSRIRLDHPAHLREVLGHKPREVTVGAVLGVVLAGVFNYDHLTPLTNWLQTRPVDWEMWLYLGIAAFLIVGGLVQRIVIGRVWSRSGTMRRLTRRIVTAAETIGWLLALSGVFIYENASFAAWRFWADLILALGVVWGVLILQEAVGSVPEELAAEAAAARKRRWLTFGRRRRKR